jgi:plastocyanin
MDARLALVPLVVAALAMGACGSSSGSGGGGGDTPTTLKSGDIIGMKNLKFIPADVVVKSGQTVIWRNDESIPHDVVAKSGATFKSEVFGKDGTFRWTAGKPGTVKYVCTLHPGMDGTITVE